MVRIDWADPALSGELFEKIVGCLLGIEHPDSVRVRPSQGDGGVDIFTPVGDDQIDVHQVKHYPRDLHWSKVKASLRRLAGGTWEDRTIRTWYLTVPKQPTPENLTKLAEIVADVWDEPPFETRWFGEDRLAALAARHPEVGDYYRGDGRAQLQRIIGDWESYLSRMAGGESPRIEDVQERLTEIAAALGRGDPHFEYGLDVHPAGRATGAPPRPGAIAMSSQPVGDHVVSCQTYLRYRGAEEDAGDRLGLRLDLRPEARQVVAQAIAVGGEPVELTPADIIDFQGPALGHQMPAGAEFFARITPYVDITPAVLRLVLATEQGARTVVPFTRRSLSPGTEGATAVWESPHRCFTLTTVANVVQERVRLSLERTFEFEGPITRVAGDINLTRALQPGTTISLAPDRGPVDTTSVSVTLAQSYVDPLAVSMLDALRVIQDHTRSIVSIPEETTVDGLRDVIEVAALLDGLATTGDMRRLTTAPKLPRSVLGLEGAGSVFRDQFTLGFVVPYGRQIDLPHQTVELPSDLFFVRVFRSVRVASINNADADDALVTLEPGLIPFWIDQRIDQPEDFTDALHHDLCQLDDPISTADLTAQLARRGTHPSA
jgi:hypothetical protein